MNFERDQVSLQTSETPLLLPEALTVEQELRQCREDLKRARTAQHHFQVFSNRVTDYAFITFDPQNRITSWSPGAERILGYSEAEILGQSGSVFFTPEDRMN